MHNAEEVKQHNREIQEGFRYIVMPPGGLMNHAIVIAASRAGALGVLDLEYVRDRSAASIALQNVAAHTSSKLGIKLDGYAFASWSELLTDLPKKVRTVIVTYSNSHSLEIQVKVLRRQGLCVILEATSLEEACAGEEAGVDGVIAKGNEAGGRVGEETAFILLQRLLRRLSIPIWVQGGIGLHTAAACYAAGAAGVVLDWQLALVRESSFSEEIKSLVVRMDGSESVSVGQTLGQAYRMCARPTSPTITYLREQESRLSSIEDRVKRLAQWRDIIVQSLVQERLDGLLFLGQDIAFASILAKRFPTVTSIVDGIRRSIATHCEAVGRLQPLKEDSTLAKVHGTRYPIVQGPMSRISDTPAFAATIAEGGGLPFLALGMMPVDEIESMLEQTKALLDGRSWGVGLLGFIADEFLRKQMGIVRKFNPPFALIAGGRPGQAHALEAEGITTYLHVPSPRLLRLYLEEGIKHFIFEGRECGGHIGPLSSFTLWESSVEMLLEMIPGKAEASEYHVLFAGGIHDALSSAMVGTLAAMLAERGVRIGVLVGTGYLFTKEAVEIGAICEGFQKVLLKGQGTVLLESGGGHAIRCIDSEFVRTFQNEKQRLQTEGKITEDVRAALEQLSLGRLRLAAKGVVFNPVSLEDLSAPVTLDVSEEEQRKQGLYMAGQVVGMYDRPFTIRELHEDISRRGSERLLTLVVPKDHFELGIRTLEPCKVAIVGMSCILPKAKDLKTYWENIVNKVNAVTEIPAERWDWHKYYDPDPQARDKSYSRWGGFLDPIPFEPTDYGMPPNSLRSIDPEQILALETARAAIWDAGYADREFDREHASVIFGVGGGLGDFGSLYSFRTLLPLFARDIPPEVWEQLPEWTEDSFSGLLLNVVSGRIANYFDFGGVNFAIDAACASSLAAVYHAVRELTVGSSNMVIAGGVETVQSPFSYLCFSKTHALSPTGQGRAFDASADGIVISEGVAVVVLKRLEDAERDGDKIYAVIRGVGGSSDGRGKGLTAPRPEGQTKALHRAYKSAGLSPATVELIEAHGTGTVAGDRAEATSLEMVFKSANAPLRSCAVGSVKSMIGHTKATTGIAGLIKVALSLYHKVLPPTLGVKTPNPDSVFNHGPLYVNTEARPWIGSRGPRRAGVSAFGFGGTNFHAVLEGYDDTTSSSCALETWPSELFCWSGVSVEELLASMEPLERALGRGVRQSLRDLAYTVDRNAIQYRKEEPRRTVRLAIVAESVEDLREKLSHARQELNQKPKSISNPRGIYYSAQPLAKDGKIAFLFPGQGSQRPDMLRDLTIIFPEMKQCFYKADKVLIDRIPKRLSEYIFPPSRFTSEEEKTCLAELTRTDIAQPALAAVEIGILHVLKSFGLAPDMVAGHSAGEYMALSAAGVFSEQTLYEILNYRGTAILDMGEKDLGTMVAVMGGPDEIEEAIQDIANVHMANYNSPGQTVLSGDREALKEVTSRLEARKIKFRFISVNCAFHSPYMLPARERLAQILSSVRFNTPSIAVYSNSLAAPYPVDEGEMVFCLSDHLIRSVRFKQEIETMFDDGARIFVEVGPRNVLTNLVNQILKGKRYVSIACNTPALQHDITQFHHALAQLLAEGVDIRFDRLFHGREVHKLSINDLKPGSDKPSVGPTTWMVAGDRTWPADKTRPVRKQTSWGQAKDQTLISLPENFPVDSNTDEVMIKYQKLMTLFLQQQRDIMLAFLQGARPKTLTAAPPEPVISSAEPTSLPLEELPASSEEESGSGIVKREDVEKILINLTSERTGYPPEMLDFDLNMEADLGIDSIKRVEILSVFLKGLPNAPADLADKLTAAKTLRDVINQAVQACQESGMLIAETTNQTDTLASTEATTSEPLEEVPRCLLRLTQHQLDANSKVRVPSGVIVITDDEESYAEALQAKIQGLGGAAVIVRLANTTRQLSEKDFAVNLTQPTDVKAFIEQLRVSYKSIGGVVHLLPLRPAPAGEMLNTEAWQRYLNEEVKSFFYLLRAAATDLKEGQPKWVIGCTKLGGECRDRNYPTPTYPWRGGIIGIIKTVRLEWPEATCKSIDTDGGTSQEELVSQLLAEVRTPDDQGEVYYRNTVRWLPEAWRVPLHETNGNRIRIRRDDVILVTGGARGITAEVTRELARCYQPIILLAGRSAWPDDESLSTAAIASEGGLKGVLIDQMRRGGKKPTPKDVEATYGRIIADREMRATKRALEEAGARVFYYQVDVRNDQAFISLIDNIYKTYGRLDGVINGAGIIEDKLLEDKVPESFDRVFDTKTRAALILNTCLKPESLKFLVFFSSIAGSFGNRGQSDYSAANEVLNRLAMYLDARWPGRVVAINWGPWEKVGMANSAVQRQFVERGIIPIPPSVGRKALVDELFYGEPGQSLVVFGRGPWVKE